MYFLSVFSLFLLLIKDISHFEYPIKIFCLSLIASAKNERKCLGLDWNAIYIKYITDCCILPNPFSFRNLFRRMYALYLDLIVLMSFLFVRYLCLLLHIYNSIIYRNFFSIISCLYRKIDIITC